MIKKIINFLFFIKPNKKKKEKKELIIENINASNNRPVLVNLLDEVKAREVNSNPDSIYESIADLIVKNIIEDSRKENDGDDSEPIEIEKFIREGEIGFLKRESEELHKNRVNIKSMLRKESYNGNFLLEDDEYINNKNNKK